MALCSDIQRHHDGQIFHHYGGKLHRSGIGYSASAFVIGRTSLYSVKKLAATDATAKNPMQATDATATPTDVLLGFVMRNPTSSHCSQNLQFGNY